MKTLHRAFVVTVLAFCASHVTAQKGNLITAIGDPNCERWVTQKLPQDRSWFMGYLSGFNGGLLTLGKGTLGDPLSKLGPSDQAILWMDNYCKANSLKTVGEGAQILFLEIFKR